MNPGACSALYRSVLLTSSLQLEPHSATCGPLLLQTPAGQVSLHTPTDAAGGHRCSVLGAVSRGHWWSVTAGAEDSPAGPYRWQPALRLLPHWSPGNTCKWQNKEPHEKTLTWEMSSFSQFYQRLGVFFFYNYYFLFFCDVTKMLNNETCSLKWKVS